MLLVKANGNELKAGSREDLDRSLSAVESTRALELSISIVGGPSLTMLRSDDLAFLMYLREEGDSGFVSGHPTPATPVARFRLCNGQIDTYPVAWCIPVDACFRAVVFFYVNDGARSDRVNWHEP
jgi:hypothetical protein